MFQTVKVTAVDPANGMVQVIYSNTGTVSQMKIPPVFGGSLTGIQYTPEVGDVLYMDDSDGFTTYLIGSTVLQLDTKLQVGQLRIFNKAGASVVLNVDGSISLIPADGKSIYLGPDTSAFKAFVRDGDTITGVDSKGDAVTGTVHASSSISLGG